MLGASSGAATQPLPAAPLLAETGATLTKSVTFSAANFRCLGVQNSLPILPISATGAIQNPSPHLPKLVTCSRPSRVHSFVTRALRVACASCVWPYHSAGMSAVQGRAVSASAKRLALDGAPFARATIRPAHEKRSCRLSRQCDSGAFMSRSGQSRQYSQIHNETKSC